MKDSEIWKELKKWLLSTDLVEPGIYDEYFKNASLSTIYDNKLAIIFKSDFAKTVLNGIKDDLNNKINLLKGEECELSLLTTEEFNKEKKIFEKVINKKKNSTNQLTFENFVTGNSNKEAFNALNAVIDELGTKWNPLFIFGDSGLGKTHLLRAFENRISEVDSSITVKYFTSTDFRKDVVDAISEKQQHVVEDMKKNYTTADVLLIDDIQFIAKSDKTNEVLFDIFNSFIDQSKQIILTSDRYPEQLNGFEKRLISRFNSGLTVKVDKPDFNTSLNIVDFKTKVQNISIADDVKNYIATYFGNDIRKIEGIINKIDFWFINNIIDKNSDTVVTLDQISSIFDNYSINTQGEITANRIKEIVAADYNTSVKLLESNNRSSKIVTPRHIAMYLCVTLLKMSYSDVGISFGGKDHTTVMNAYRKIEGYIKVDKNVASYIKKTTKKLSAK